jgi:tetratricopeptide (TPR) repeat protein
LEERDAYKLLKRGLALLEEGHPARAAAALERALELEPDKGSILEALGRAYFSSGRYSFAERCFREALRIAPNNDYAHYCLGLCLLKADRTIEAGAHFKLAWCMRPSEVYREKAARFGAAGARPSAGVG